MTRQQIVSRILLERLGFTVTQRYGFLVAEKPGLQACLVVSPSGFTKSVNRVTREVYHNISILLTDLV